MGIYLATIGMCLLFMILSCQTDAAVQIPLAARIGQCKSKISKFYRCVVYNGQIESVATAKYIF